MEFPCQPCEETQQLCGAKVAASRCCPQSTWQEEFHARIVPDTSLFECTSTEHVKKIPARKMAFKHVKSRPAFSDGVREQSHTIQSTWHAGQNGVRQSIKKCDTEREQGRVGACDSQ
ncbi:hypothetical protein TcCL_Unassigned00654 [Trypanosoma cruzi]|nr:hypothetical protein TcCL_Unassigned00654 [Trypanosoma cruzi]